MSKRAAILLIEDIIESANKIIAYTDNMSFDEFTNDSKTIPFNYLILGANSSK